jgi:hypothetical protein
LKHLTISAIHALFSAHSVVSVSGKSLECDLNELDLSPIVTCVQFVSASTSELGQQVRNSALRLLATMTRVLPEKISQLVLPVFSHALQQGESLGSEGSYSFLVLRQAMEAIIPSMVPLQPSDSLSAVARLLILQFVQSIFRIPPASQCQLLSVLVESLGPSCHLRHTLFLLLAEGVNAETQNPKLLKKGSDKKQTSHSKAKLVCELASNLCLQFPPSVQVKALASLMDAVDKESHTLGSKLAAEPSESQQLLHRAAVLVRAHLSNVAFLRQLTKFQDEQVTE